MRKAYALTIAAAILLAGCGNKKNDDIEVAVNTGVESTVADTHDAISETTGDEGRTQEKATTKETSSEYSTTSSDEKISLSETTDEVKVHGDGSISVQLKNNVLATDEESTDPTYYRVYPADYKNLVLYSDEMTEEETLDIYIESRMKKANIPEGMALMDGDVVTVHIDSCDDPEMSSLIGSEEEITLGEYADDDEATAAIKKSSVGDTVEISNSGEGQTYSMKMTIVSAIGKRTKDDLTDAWVQANYPDCGDVAGFLDFLKDRIQTSEEETKKDNNSLRDALKDRYLDETKIEGIEQYDDISLWKAIASSALATEMGIDISDDAFEKYIEEQIKDAGASNEEAYLKEQGITLDEAKSEFVDVRLYQKLVDSYRERMGEKNE